MEKENECGKGFRSARKLEVATSIADNSSRSQIVTLKGM